MNILEVQEDEKEILTILGKSLKHNSPTNNTEEFISVTNKLSLRLPSRIKKELEKFKKSGHEYGALLIRNLPNEPFVITPKDNKEHIGETTILANVQALFNEYIGHMVSYEAEGDGYLFQDMVPNKELRKTQTSLGSNVELELHTEQAFSDYRPDYLSLACIKGDKRAYTFFLHVNQILEQMTDDEIHYLEKEKWKIGVDMSFALNGCDFAARGPLSILKYNGQHYDLVFDQDLLMGMSITSSKMIGEIVDIYYKCRNGYVLRPGEILMLDNNKVLHGRSPFQPKFDGNDRFIVRSFIMNDLEKIAGKTHGVRNVKCRWS
jgi:L-asparagine oxygenase